MDFFLKGFWKNNFEGIFTKGIPSISPIMHAKFHQNYDFSVQVEKTSTESIKTSTTELTKITTQEITTKPKTESILIDLLLTTTKTTTIETLPQCIPSNSTSTDCMDNHTFYVVIILGLVISNCILSCLSIQKR